MTYICRVCVPLKTFNAKNKFYPFENFFCCPQAVKYVLKTRSLDPLSGRWLFRSADQQLDGCSIESAWVIGVW